MKSRRASRSRRLAGCRLAMATSTSSRIIWRSGRFWRRASSSRHSASRRAISSPRRLSWCRPGSRRQRSSSARSAIASRKSANSASAQAIRPSRAKLGTRGDRPGQGGSGRRRAHSEAGPRVRGRRRQSVRVSLPARGLSRPGRPGSPARADNCSRPAPRRSGRRRPAAGAPGAEQADPHVLAGRVHHDLERRVVHQAPRRGSSLADLSGSITARRSRGRHLDQAEHRLESLFRDELGVEGKPLHGSNVIRPARGAGPAW